MARHSRLPAMTPTVRIHGREQPYLNCRLVRRRKYYLLHPVGSPARERYAAFDPLAGPGGDFFQVQVWASGAATEQFLRVARRLKHDAFPRVVEWSRDGKETTCVLTWTDGVSLADYFATLRAGRRPPVDPGQAVRLIWGLANGVCRLHQSLRVYHGDIQPANVIITSHPSRLALIDFGSACTAEAGMQRVDGDGRHPCYSAPELDRDPATPVSFTTDQFSVSVLFYELLTQQIPYDGLGGKAGRPEYRQQAASALLPPSALSPACRQLPRSLQQHLDEVVLRGLALEPGTRFSDRHAWLQELFETQTRFRLTPELPAVEDWVTRVIQWFVRPRLPGSGSSP
jgi:serine/threonine protein kinase